MVPCRYAGVVDVSSGNWNLLFSAQERGVFRLPKETVQRNGALVLTAEVEAGLHPWAQQLLMLPLAQLALRADPQTIVTTHSPGAAGLGPVNGESPGIARRAVACRWSRPMSTWGRTRCTAPRGTRSTCCVKTKKRRPSCSFSLAQLSWVGCLVIDYDFDATYDTKVVHSPVPTRNR